MRTLLTLLAGFVLTGCHCGSTALDNTGGGPDSGADDGGDSGVPDGGGCTPQNGACALSTDCCSGLTCRQNSCQPDPNNGCGLNSVPCSGRCVVTLTDPQNCGGCGIQCTSNQVCTRASCQDPSSCPQGLSACAGTCVDFQTSNTHCGGCPGIQCPAGQGCAGGNCVPSILLLDGGQPCPGGGSPVRVQTDAGQLCAGSIAQVTFRWAMCSCNDITTSSLFQTDAFNSGAGPSSDGGLGGGVGANGAFTASSSFDIGGTGWFGGASGFVISSLGNQVRQQLWVNGPASGGGSSGVGASAYINGNVQTNLSIAGTLYVPNSASVGSGVQASGGIVRGPVSVPPPCDCAPQQLIDVASIVNDGTVNNDNSSIGLNPAVFENASTAHRLDLPCGRYYLTKITSSSPVAIAVHGRTALFVGGNVTPSSSLSITIDPQAELDIFIGGTLSASSGLSLGSTEVPAQSRIYIAGTPVALSSNALIAGNFYLPYASFRPSAPLSLYGSVFCGSYNGSSSTRIHYDRAILSAGEECGTPASDGGTADGGPTGCTSCRDCGNQGCNGGICGPCQSQQDCCAPLTCVSGVCGLRLN